MQNQYPLNFLSRFAGRVYSLSRSSEPFIVHAREDTDDLGWFMLFTAVKSGYITSLYIQRDDLDDVHVRALAEAVRNNKRFTSLTLKSGTHGRSPADATFLTLFDALRTAPNLTSVGIRYDRPPPKFIDAQVCTIVALSNITRFQFVLPSYTDAATDYLFHVVNSSVTLRQLFFSRAMLPYIAKLRNPNITHLILEPLAQWGALPATAFDELIRWLSTYPPHGMLAMVQISLEFFYEYEKINEMSASLVTFLVEAKARFEDDPPRFMIRNDRTAIFFVIPSGRKWTDMILRDLRARITEVNVATTQAVNAFADVPVTRPDGRPITVSRLLENGKRATMPVVFGDSGSLVGSRVMEFLRWPPT